MKNKIFIIVITLCSLSCATKKEINYFQDLNNISNVSNFQDLNINVGDILDIQISSINPESLQIFQPHTQSAISQNNLQSRQTNGYLVDMNNFIYLPVLGKINTVGLTTITLSREIEKKLSPFIKKPTVKTRILNFKISILGEVNNPNTFNIIEERISIPQALGLAGDLTINGDRKNIILLRNTDNKQISTIIDLTKSNFTNSEFFYLAQNDIIYVPPNTAKVKSSGLVGNVGTLTSVLSLILSLAVVLSR